MNGKRLLANAKLQANDLLEHEIHRHEPAVTCRSPEITFISEDGLMIVDKPASIPVHPTGIYYANTVTEILKKEHGFKFLASKSCYNRQTMSLWERVTFLLDINRLDRLTSGLLVMATNSSKAIELSKLMSNRQIHKEYIAKVKGKLPGPHDLGQKVYSNINDCSSGYVRSKIVDNEEWTLCSAPLSKIEHKIGLCAVSVDGKESTTLFKLLEHSSVEDTSLVLCRPLTGRTHQIRVHLQFLGNMEN